MSRRVARLMRHHGIRGLAGRRFRPYTTESRHDLSIAPNRLKQAFTATAPNTVWLADVGKAQSIYRNAPRLLHAEAD